MEPCLRFLVTSTITVKSVTGYSESGNETLGAARAVKAYVEQQTDIMTSGSSGAERQTRTVIVTEDAISVDDRIWMEGDDTSIATFSRRPSEVTVMKHPVTGKVSHYEVML